MKFIIGLIVEGDYDSSALKAYITKHLKRDIDFIERPCGGPIKDKWLGYLEEFRVMAEEGKRIGRVVVARDSDSLNPNDILHNLQQKISSKAEFPFPITFGIPVKMLEAWLLADEKSLSRRIGAKIPQFENDLEQYQNPKADLEHLLILNGIVYTKAVAGELASLSNLRTVKKRCLWFKSFLSDL